MFRCRIPHRWSPSLFSTGHYSTFKNMKLLFGDQIHSISSLGTIQETKAEFGQRIGINNIERIVFYPLRKVDKQWEALTPEELMQNKYFNLEDEVFEINFEKQLDNNEKLNDQNQFVLAALKTNFQILYSAFFSSKDLYNVPVTTIPFQSGEITFLVHNKAKIKDFILRKIQLEQVVIFKTQMGQNPIVTNTNANTEYNFEKEILQAIDEGKVFDVYGVLPKQSLLKTVRNSALYFVFILWVYLYIL